MSGLRFGLSLSMQGRGGTRFGARSPAGYLLDHLGSEPSGFAVDFVAMDCLARGGPSPYSGDPNGKLTYTAPSTKWITNRHGLLASGTTLRCDHDASTLDTSASSDNSLGVGNGGVVRKTLTTSGAVTYVAGQDIVASDASDIAKWMAGRVVSYAGGSLVVDFRAASGYFTCSSWKIIVALGLLVEEQRTNLLLGSDAPTTQIITATATPYTLSFWGEGSIALSGASTAGPLVGTGDDDRVSLTFTPTAGALTLTIIGTVVRAQLEVGTFPTSYIQTSGSAVTRAADNIWMPSASAPIKLAEGTWLVEASRLNASATHSVVFIVRNTATANQDRVPEMALGTSPGGTAGTARCDYYMGGVLQANIGSTAAFVANRFYKIGTAYALNDFATRIDGAVPSHPSDVSGALPAAVDRIEIGSRVSGINHLNGHIKSLIYIPRRLPNAELVTRSTPS
jgi:hypothetical protein